MKNTLETLEKREKYLEDKISKEKEGAKSSLSTNKSGIVSFTLCLI